MLINKLDVYGRGWTELVFQGRNQLYGAYQLRRGSEKYLFRALLAGAGLFLAAVAGIWYSGNRSDEVVHEVKIPPMAQPPVFTPEKPRPEPPKAVERSKPAPKVATKKYVAPKVVPDQLAVNPPPAMKELEHTQIGQIDIDGKKGDDNAIVKNEGENGSGGIGTDDGIHGMATIEVMPEFEGGLQGWAKYLQRNLRYPETAVNNETQGRVTVTFIVEKDGSLSDIRVLSGIGSGCDEEAIRVLKKAPKWTPGIQNGHPVRVQYTLPINFRLN
ncbi:MAG: TonB family protein [Mucilaginibacter polytrichastri]|nr:TonB family protein [Mucilaginibacter polytrichastri]